MVPATSWDLFYSSSCGGEFASKQFPPRIPAEEVFKPLTHALPYCSNKCYVETGFAYDHYASCRGTYKLGSMISYYIIGYFMINLVHTSIANEWRADISVSLEKIITLDLTFRQVRSLHDLILSSNQLITHTVGLT